MAPFPLPPTPDGMIRLYRVHPRGQGLPAPWVSRLLGICPRFGDLARTDVRGMFDLTTGCDIVFPLRVGWYVEVYRGERRRPRVECQYFAFVRADTMVRLDRSELPWT